MHNGHRRDFEDSILDGTRQPTFDMKYLIDTVNEYRIAEKCSFADAVEGIAEGHELPTDQVNDLLAYFCGTRVAS